MAKLYGNKTLFIVLVVLIAVVIFAEQTNWRNQERTFRRQLGAVDTAKVEKIILNPKEGPDEEVVLVSSGRGNWKAKRGKETDEASREKVKQMLGKLNDLEVKRLVAKNKKEWEDFGVTGKAGSRMRVFEEGKQTLDIILGDMKSRNMEVFVRLKEGTKVYSVDTKFGLYANRSWNDWRDKTFISGKTSTWKKVTYNYPKDSGFKVVRDTGSGNWNMDGKEVDSSKMVAFFNQLTQHNNMDFRNNFEPGDDQMPFYEMIIKAPERKGRIVVHAYKDKNGDFVLHSNLNRNAWFDGNRVVDKVFRGKDYFFKKASGTGAKAMSSSKRRQLRKRMMKQKMMKRRMRQRRMNQE